MTPISAPTSSLDVGSSPDPALEAALREFAPEGVYLDSATYGLAPRSTRDAVVAATEAWHRGRGRWIEDWDREGEACRALFAGLVGGRSEEVALLPAVSVASALVAASVPRGGEVLMAEGDFTSVTYPMVVAAGRRGLTVRQAPLEDLPGAVRPTTSLVAVSHVQSASGERVDLEALRSAVDRVGARLYLDGSQSFGVVPVDLASSGADVAACAAYKWLCCPRGTAFLWVRPERWPELDPIFANWRAGDDPYGRFYGAEPALAPDAARFDVSLAWHAWVGARRSLEVLASLDASTRHRRAMDCARRIAAGLGLPEPATPIVSIPVSDSEMARASLEEVGVRASIRAGQVRVSPHFYNGPEDADRAHEVLAPWVRGGDRSSSSSAG